MIKRAINSLRHRGIKGSFQRIVRGRPKTSVFDTWDFIVNQEVIPFNEEDYELNKNKNKTLNWVIPEMSAGSGGHLNIFRFITYLEKRGIHNRVYLFKSSRFLND